MGGRCCCLREGGRVEVVSPERAAGAACKRNRLQPRAEGAEAAKQRELESCDLAPVADVYGWSAEPLDLDI